MFLPCEGCSIFWRRGPVQGGEIAQQERVPWSVPLARNQNRFFISSSQHWRSSPPKTGWIKEVKLVRHKPTLADMKNHSAYATRRLSSCTANCSLSLSRRKGKKRAERERERDRSYNHSQTKISRLSLGQCEMPNGNCSDWEGVVGEEKGRCTSTAFHTRTTKAALVFNSVVDPPTRRHTRPRRVFKTACLTPKARQERDITH